MSDKPDDKLESLFAAARATEWDTRPAEFGFETRLAARLREESSGSISAWAWKLCPFFAALALAAAWWGLVNVREEATTRIVSETMSDNAEQALLAYLTGDDR